MEDSTIISHLVPYLPVTPTSAFVSVQSASKQGKFGENCRLTLRALRHFGVSQRYYGGKVWLTIIIEACCSKSKFVGSLSYLAPIGVAPTAPLSGSRSWRGDNL